jgi:hypothetical protein
MFGELNQYAEDAAPTNWAYGAKDFLDFGLNSWAKVEQINAVKDTRKTSANPLADVDQQPALVVSKQEAAPAGEVMVWGYPQKNVIAGFGLLLIVGLFLRGKS